MKRLFTFGLLVFATLLIFLWWRKEMLPVSSATDPVDFVITRGSSASQIANKLVDQQLIRSALVFKVYLQLSGKAGKIQAGEYRLYANRSLPQLVSELLKGPQEIWVTIPEGLRREEIAFKIADSLSKTGEEYTTFVNEFLNLTTKSEGYLFPDTYLFPREVKAAVVYSKLIDTFNKRVDFEVSEKEIILASLIERETRGNEEKPVVAGILLKRLEAGWPLQVDATIQYAVGSKGRYWEPVTKDDLEVKSPYNTYRNRGLPPTPICNPGLASIKAAVSPTSTSYWFYLHDNQGLIHYAEDAEEHAVNVAEYLK